MIVRPPINDNSVVHLVYPHGPKISHPDSLGRNLGRRLEGKYDVRYYNWAGIRRIAPARGDILIGHACPIPFTVFRRSCKDRRWGRVLLMSPHCHGDTHQPAFNEHVIYDCDLYLAITGNYWFRDVENSAFSHWRPKMRHFDLAVDRNDYPVIKREFNVPGRRRFLYVGTSAWYKNVGYLSKIATALPNMEFAHAGVDRALPGIRALGWQDFSGERGRGVASNYDFMITVGKADGNPTTILESMAWGLIPVCTPQSGFIGYSSIPNVPLYDHEGAAKIIIQLQNAEESVLRGWQEENWLLLDKHFNWDRFARQVMEAIGSAESPVMKRASLSRRCYLACAELTNPFWLWNLRAKSVKKVFKMICEG